MRCYPKPPPAASEPQLSLLVPIAAWPAPPRHDVTCICVTSMPRAALVSGSSTGQVCLWGVEDGPGDDGDEEHAAAASLRLSPRVMLLGHSAPVVWVASCLFERLDALCSLCHGGLLNVWDPMDGRCLSSSPTSLLPSATVGAMLPGLKHAVIGGENQTLCIVQLSTMTVRCVLSPLDDWCMAVAATPGGAEQHARLVCLDASGGVRSWQLLVHPNGNVEVAAPPLRCALLPPRAELLKAKPMQHAVDEEARQLAYLRSVLERRRREAEAAKAASTKALLAKKAAEANPFDEELKQRRTLTYRTAAESDMAEEEGGEGGARVEGASSVPDPPLPLSAQRFVQLSADGTLVLLLDPQGTLWLYAMPAALWERPSVPPPQVLLVLPAAISRAEEGWAGARLVHGGGGGACSNDSWAVVAWSAVIPPTLFAVPPFLVEPADAPEGAEHAIVPRAVVEAAQEAAAAAEKAKRAAVEEVAGEAAAEGHPNALLRCAAAVLAPWLASVAPKASPLAHAIAIADSAGTMHIYVADLLSPRAASAVVASAAPLTRLGHAPLTRGWAPVPPGEPSVSASALVAQDGVPVQLLLGYTDGSIGRLRLPGGGVPQGRRAAHPSRVSAILPLKLGTSSAARSAFAPATAPATAPLSDGIADVNGSTGDGDAAGESGEASGIPQSGIPIACLFFASASSLGEVVIWSLHRLQPLRRFKEHSGPITTLLQPPPGVPLHMERWVLAVGTDGAISIYDVSELPLMPTALRGSDAGWRHADASDRVSCIGLLNGHLEPIRELQWRPAEGMLCVRCALEWCGSGDGFCGTGATVAMGSTVYIWQLQAGRLARVLRGPEAQPHLEAMAHAPLSQSVPELAISRELRSTSSKRVLENVRIGLGGTNAPLHALLFNVKRLALEAKRSANERERSYQLGPSPRAPRRQSREMFTSFSALDGEDARSGLCSQARCPQAIDGEDAKELEVRRQARSTQLRWLAAQEQKEGAAAAAGAAATAEATPSTLPASLEPLLESIPKDEGLVPSSAEASSSKPGEVDSAAPLAKIRPLAKLLAESDHDKRATLEAVETRGPRPSDVIACQSALSYMTCWGVDPAFDAECSDIIGLRPPVPQVTYGVRGHGGNFSFLTPCAHTRHHRWQCSSHLTALHSIAAVTLSNTLMMCPGYDDVRNACSSLVTHFSVVLPEKLPLFCAPSLSLLASHYVDPVEEVQQAARALMEGTLHRMKPEVRQQLVAAWAPRVLRLAEPARRASTDAAAGSKPVRVVAEDLSSPQGVSVLVLAVLASRFFTPLDAQLSTIVVNQLTALLDHPSELHRTAAAELLGKGYPIWKAHVADPPTLIRTLFLLSAATSNPPPSPPAATAKDAAPPLAALAAPNRFQAALLAVGSSEPRAFCRAMGEHAAYMSHPAPVRRAAVNALISLVKARGVSLEAELPSVVAAVLRPLDPSVPSLREGCLVASTTALRELVKRYPMMAFHHGTQRLAVGTIEGVVILYDMRTATKWRILQGHEHAVTCLAFSAAGDFVASASIEERALRWWLAGSQGFFGFIGLHASCLHTTTLKEFAHADTADNAAELRIEWASDNSVTLTSNRRMLATYTKPSVYRGLTFAD